MSAAADDSWRYVNQTQGGGTWNRLSGQYLFNSGYTYMNGSVTISTEGTATNKHVIADAVRFVKVP